jgi:prepilin-type N-terminal cleavage/methylation domain-containing protein
MKKIKKYERGFSLLELIVTLLVIAILSLSAIIVYQVPMIKSYQIAAKIDLLNLASIIDRYRSNTPGTGPPSLDSLGFIPVSRNYDFLVQNYTGTSYSIKAIPRRTSQLDSCQTFVIDQDGNKAITGAGPIDECW